MKILTWLSDLWFRLTNRRLESWAVDSIRKQLEKIWPRPRVVFSSDNDTALESRDAALGAVPWEIVRCGSNRFYRIQRGSPLPDTVRWMRRAIETIGLSELSSGPSDFARFVDELGGPENFRRTLLERMNPRSQQLVLLLQAGAETQRRSRASYGAGGLRLEQEYANGGFRTYSLPLDPEALMSVLPGNDYPSVVHIAAQMGESFTPREPFLSAGEGSKPLRVEVLTHFLSRWPENQLRPFVILEAADNPFDRGRTLLLRNAFANRLFLENTRGVLAIGPYRTESLSRMIASLRSVLVTGAIADLHRNFWAIEKDPAPALFTLDPDLPVWD